MSVVPHFEALPFYFEPEEGRPDGVDDGRVPGLFLAEVSFDPFKTTVFRAHSPQGSTRPANGQASPQLSQSIKRQSLCFEFLPKSGFFYLVNFTSSPPTRSGWCLVLQGLAAKPRMAWWSDSSGG